MQNDFNEPQIEPQVEPKQFIVHKIPSIFSIYDLLDAFDRQWGINVLVKKNWPERRNLIVHLGSELHRLGAKKVFVGEKPFWTTLKCKKSFAKALVTQPQNLYFEVEWLGREKTNFDFAMGVEIEKYKKSLCKNDIFDKIIEYFC